MRVCTSSSVCLYLRKVSSLIFSMGRSSPGRRANTGSFSIVSKTRFCKKEMNEKSSFRKLQMWPTGQEAGPLQSVNFSWRSLKYPSHLQVQLHSFGSKAEAATSTSFIVIVKVILRFRFEIGDEEGSPSAHRFLLPPGRGPCPSN